MVFAECCSGMNPFLYKKTMKVSAFGTIPYVRFIFEPGQRPRVVG